MKTRIKNISRASKILSVDNPANFFFVWIIKIGVFFVLLSILPAILVSKSGFLGIISGYLISLGAIFFVYLAYKIIHYTGIKIDRSIKNGTNFKIDQKMYNHTKMFISMNFKNHHNYNKHPQLQVQFQKYLFWKNIRNSIISAYSVGILFCLIFFAYLQEYLALSTVIYIVIGITLGSFIYGMKKYVYYRKNKNKITLLSLNSKPKVYRWLKDRIFFY